MEDYLWEIAQNNETRLKALIDEANVTRPIALVLDNSHLTIPQQKQWLLDRFQEITASNE